MPCGIMDQYISIFGKERSAVEIDCRSLEHRDVRLPESVAFVAVNTMVKHALAASAYRERVAECAAAVETIRNRFPETATLRDVTPAQFQTVEDLLPKPIVQRARHVIGENERVRSFVVASEHADPRRMGALMVESHRSLQRDYAVSCEELDFLVDHAAQIEGVYGSRMTGGGFGGCTVTMLHPECIAHFRRSITQAYESQFEVTPAVYPCDPASGAGEVKNFETIPAVN
jgi:galactokinase